MLQVRWFLFDVLVTNAYILSWLDVFSGAHLDHKQFRLRLAEQLIGSYSSRKRVGRLKKRSCPPPSTGIPTYTKKRRCVYCRDVRSQSRRKESVWACTACDGQPNLCLTGKEDGTGFGTNSNSVLYLTLSLSHTHTYTHIIYEVVCDCEFHRP